MVQRVQIVLTDDLDGSEADSTVIFGYAGTTYEIDLADANRKVLETALAPYLAAGRRVVAPRRSGSARRRTSGDASATEIRAWAASQGMKISSRGRVASEVRDAYVSAHA